MGLDHYRDMLMENLEILGFCGTWKTRKRDKSPEVCYLQVVSFIYSTYTYSAPTLRRVCYGHEWFGDPRES